MDVKTLTGIGAVRVPAAERDTSNAPRRTSSVPLPLSGLRVSADLSDLRTTVPANEAMSEEGEHPSRAETLPPNADVADEEPFGLVALAPSSRDEPALAMSIDAEALDTGRPTPVAVFTPAPSEALASERLTAIGHPPTEVARVARLVAQATLPEHPAVKPRPPEPGPTMRLQKVQRTPENAAVSRDSLGAKVQVPTSPSPSLASSPNRARLPRSEDPADVAPHGGGGRKGAAIEERVHVARKDPRREDD